MGEGGTRGPGGADQGSLNNWAPLSIDGWSFCKNWNLRFKLDFHGWSFRQNRNLRFKPDFHHSSHVLAVQFQWWAIRWPLGKCLLVVSSEERQKQQYIQLWFSRRMNGFGKGSCSINTARGDELGKAPPKKRFYLGLSPKQRTTPTHPYGLGLQK